MWFLRQSDQPETKLQKETNTEQITTDPLEHTQLVCCNEASDQILSKEDLQMHCVTVTSSFKGKCTI